MKKFFVVVFVLILLVSAAIAVFVLTFDANRYKPMLIENLRSHLKMTRCFASQVKKHEELSSS